MLWRFVVEGDRWHDIYPIMAAELSNYFGLVLLPTNLLAGPNEQRLVAEKISPEDKMAATSIARRTRYGAAAACCGWRRKPEEASGRKKKLALGARENR